jgi:hypothetical protein
MNFRNIKSEISGTDQFSFNTGNAPIIRGESIHKLGLV